MYAEHEAVELREFKDVEKLRARAEVAEQRAEALQASLGAARMDVRDLIESCGIVSQRVTNAIETIVIYETRTHVARDSMNLMKRQEDKVAENASNKKKWKGDHDGSPSQQQNKGHKVIRAHVVRPRNKKVYAGKLLHCNRTLQERSPKMEESEACDPTPEEKSSWRL
nr:hypothetical protein [Tanacetum cinerariifolium]